MRRVESRKEAAPAHGLENSDGVAKLLREWQAFCRNRRQAKTQCVRVCMCMCVCVYVCGNGEHGHTRVSESAQCFGCVLCREPKTCGKEKERREFGLFYIYRCLLCSLCSACIFVFWFLFFFTSKFTFDVCILPQHTIFPSHDLEENSRSTPTPTPKCRPTSENPILQKHMIHAVNALHICIF